MIRLLIVSLMLVCAKAQANEFSLLIYTAPNKLDWSSPGKLTRSTLANTLFSKIGIVEDGEYKEVSYPHAISHVNIKLHCEGEDPIYTGMTGTQSNGEYLQKLLFEGSSLETMVENTPGRLFTNEEVTKYLKAMRTWGKMHEARFLINNKTCVRLKNYLNEYQQLDQDKVYGGLASVPWKFQGAGCSAFGVGFLKAAGLYDPYFDQVWKRKLRIPERYITNEESFAERGFWSFALWRYNGKWAKGAEPSLDIEFWDPQLMFDWIVDVSYNHHSQEFRFLGLKNKFIERKSLILVFDRRNHSVPSEAPWQWEHLTE